MAQNNLGLMYREGIGVKQDDKEAAECYRLAAEQGCAVAQNSLGAMYVDGKGVAQDFVKALKWLLLAAEQGQENVLNTLKPLAATQPLPSTTARHRRHCSLADLCRRQQAQQQTRHCSDTGRRAVGKLGRVAVLLEGAATPDLVQADEPPCVSDCTKVLHILFDWPRQKLGS